MKILQIVDKGHDGGGVARHVFELIDGLRAQGHQVDVLRLHQAGSVVQEPALPWTFGPVQGLRSLPALTSQVARINPDVVHLHAGYTTFSPVLLRVLRRARPVVGTLHDVRPFCFRGTRRFRETEQVCGRTAGPGCVTSGCHRGRSVTALPRLARELSVKAWLLKEWRSLPAVIVPSAYLGDLAVQHGFATNRVNVVNHFMSPGIAAEEKPGRSPLIVYIGGIEREKGAQLLLEALTKLSDRPWRAAIVGQGSLRRELEEYAETKGLAARVQFHGWLEREACLRIIDQSCMLVFPSVVAESFGLAGLEALAHARPVIGFGTGGTSEWLVDGYTGVIARDGSSEDLARAIESLLSDPALATRLGENGRRLVEERFAPGARIADTCAVYQRAIEMFRGREAA